jgi:endonuclease/exonuclease/phosphatase family metal-dependent hydrolase
MRVLTWNLWWRFGPWEDRQPAIEAEFRRVDPDIVFLQEMWAVDGIDQARQPADAAGWDLARATELDDRSP